MTLIEDPLSTHGQLLSELDCQANHSITWRVTLTGAVLAHYCSYGILLTSHCGVILASSTPDWFQKTSAAFHTKQIYLNWSCVRDWEVLVSLGLNISGVNLW